MTWVSTRALVEGKEPGYGAGCGGRGDFPLRREVMFIYPPLLVVQLAAPWSPLLLLTFSESCCVRPTLPAPGLSVFVLPYRPLASATTALLPLGDIRAHHPSPPLFVVGLTLTFVSNLNSWGWR